MSESANKITATSTRWRAVIALGFGAFAIVAAEFLPVGILPEIARDFRISLGQASAIVLLPGLVAGLAAPVVITTVGRLDRRVLVIACTGLLIVSNVLTWSAQNFAVLLAARALVGLSLGGFWAVGPSLGVKFAALRDARAATSVVLAGISAGTVLGLPLGQAVAGAWGWRTVFLAAAAAGAVVFILQMLWVPRPPGPVARINAVSLLRIVRADTTRTVLTVAALAITGQLMASTYISVYLGSALRLNASGISVMLLVYGGIGLLGNVMAGRVHVPLRPMFGFTAALLSLVFIALPFVHTVPIVGSILVAVWGLLWGAFPFLLQSWMMSSAPEAPEAGSAVLVTFFQLSIALGSTVGGVAISTIGLTGVLIIAGVFQLVAATVTLVPIVFTASRARSGTV